MHRFVTPLLLLVAMPALAQDAPESAPAPAAGRGFDMELSLRMRSLSVPKALLNSFFYDEGDPGWIDSDPRPRIGGLSPGLEFVVKGDGPTGIFYFDYVVSTMPAGYWDDVESPPNHGDGDYLEPADNLGLWVIGADYAHDIPLVRIENTSNRFGLSFLVGGGLGVEGLVGKNPACDSAICRWGPVGLEPATIVHARGAPPAGARDLPAVLPVLDINAGLRFNFGNRVVLRFEGGFHNMIYFGSTLGIMF